MDFWCIGFDSPLDWNCEDDVFRVFGGDKIETLMDRQKLLQRRPRTYSISCSLAKWPDIGMHSTFLLE